MGDMQAASLFIAAVFSLIAIVAAFLDLSTWISVVSLAAAALFLFFGLREKFLDMEDTPIELDAEQRATIKRMKAEGDHDLAARQIQMWFRNTSYDDAAAVMREV